MEHEIKENQKITFFDVLTKRKGSNNKLETTIIREATNINMYIEWKSHEPMQ